MNRLHAAFTALDKLMSASLKPWLTVFPINFPAGHQSAAVVESQQRYGHAPGVGRHFRCEKVVGESSHVTGKKNDVASRFPTCHDIPASHRVLDVRIVISLGKVNVTPYRGYQFALWTVASKLFSGRLGWLRSLGGRTL